MAKQKIAVITGAGYGIGLALCRELLISDPEIFVVAFCRKRPALDALQKKFRARLIVERVEFNHNAAMDNIRRALERYEHMDYLVHCADIVAPLERIPTIDHKDCRKTQRVNSDIPFFMTQLCLKKFAHSRVLFLTSDQPCILPPRLNVTGTCMVEIMLIKRLSLSRLPAFFNCTDNFFNCCFVSICL